MLKKIPTILSVKELERSYPIVTSKGEKKSCHVLKGITFQVRKGEFVGIMGRSGCGKTTLLKTVGMINKPDKGTVLYKGTPTTEIRGDTLAKIRRTGVAFVFQDYCLMDSLNIQDNIILPLILNGNDPVKSIKRVHRVAGHFGITDLLDKKPYELSGGEKQRAAICRAVVVDPDLILADEPTGNLDAHSSRIVIELLEKIHNEKRSTILLVTHDAEIASYCSRVIFLNDGVIKSDIRSMGDKKEFYQRIVAEMGNITSV